MRVCPKCDSSNIVEINMHKTLAYCQPFSDDDGITHYHDNNISTITLRCSKCRHHFNESINPIFKCCEKKEEE